MSGVDGYNALPSDSEKEARDKDRTGEAFRTIVPDWIRTGKIIAGVKLTTGQTTKVSHGLKHAVTGWMIQSVRTVTSPNDNVFPIEIARDSSSITFRGGTGGSGTIKFDIWVW